MAKKNKAQNTLKKIIFIPLLCVLFFALILSLGTGTRKVYADIPPGCPGGPAGPPAPGTQCGVSGTNQCFETDPQTGQSNGNTKTCSEDNKTPHYCGKNSGKHEVKFNFGCLGQNYPTDKPDDSVSAVTDVVFAFVRFLSAGVGIIVVGAVIVAGIRYSAAQGNPQATSGAVAQIRNALIGLVLYIFTYSLLQFLVPGGAFK